MTNTANEPIRSAIARASVSADGYAAASLGTIIQTAFGIINRTGIHTPD
jgi:hypothetical protein